MYDLTSSLPDEFPARVEGTDEDRCEMATSTTNHGEPSADEVTACSESLS